MVYSESEEFDPYKDLFSDRYQAGQYLVYDCIEQHFVCTGPGELKRCEKEHESSLKKNLYNLGCVAIDKDLVRVEDCFKRQKELVVMSRKWRFCLHPEVRNRFLDLK